MFAILDRLRQKRREAERLGNAWGHFKTITKHRHLVMWHCFQVGLYWRGLTHDLSKYSWTEFRSGVRFFQNGKRSPNAEERERCGASAAWMHHKGRNKHHFEYWTDLRMDLGCYGPVPMPTQYMVEMVMDRIAACKVYRGKNYDTGAALEYLERPGGESYLIHPDTLAQTRYLLTMLRDKGEKETFRFIRQVVLKGQPFIDKITNIK